MKVNNLPGSKFLINFALTFGFSIHDAEMYRSRGKGSGSLGSFFQPKLCFSFNCCPFSLILEVNNYVAHLRLPRADSVRFLFR